MFSSPTPSFRHTPKTYRKKGSKYTNEKFEKRARRGKGCALQIDIVAAPCTTIKATALSFFGDPLFYSLSSCKTEFPDNEFLRFHGNYETIIFNVRLCVSLYINPEIARRLTARDAEKVATKIFYFIARDAAILSKVRSNI